MDCTSTGANAQLSRVADIFRDPALLRAAVERVAPVRMRDPHARHLQTIFLSSRRVIDAFWTAQQLQHFHMRGIEHEDNGKALMLIGLGLWFPPVVTDDVLAACIVPAENIVRASGSARSLLNLQPLNAVADWLPLFRVKRK